MKLSALEERLESRFDLSCAVNCRSKLRVLKGFIIVTFSTLESFMETKSEKYGITLIKIFTHLTYKTLQRVLVFLKQFLERLQVYLTL